MTFAGCSRLCPMVSPAARRSRMTRPPDLGGSAGRLLIGLRGLVLVAQQLRDAACTRPRLGPHLLLALRLPRRLPCQAEVLAARRADRVVVPLAQRAGIDLALAR